MRSAPKSTLRKIAMKLTEEQFLRDVAQHEMSILLDSGVHRHLRFSKPGNSDMYFEIVTYPGYLVYSGDMGSYVFERSRDMFDFFCSNRAYRKQRFGSQLSTNPWYWAEKLQAVSATRSSDTGVLEYNDDLARAYIKEQLVRWWRDDLRHDKAARKELREEVDQLLYGLTGCLARDYDLVNDFSCEIDGRGFCFIDVDTDAWREMTTQYLWCCYAIAWGIEQYEKASEGREYVVFDGLTAGTCVPFLREDARGYTHDLHMAKRMSKDEAMQRLALNGSDIPWLYAELQPLASPRVSCNKLPRSIPDQVQLQCAAQQLLAQSNKPTGNQVSTTQSL